MKRLFLFLALLVGALPFSAQNLLLKVGGGLASHYSNGSKPVGAFKGGLGYEIEFGQHWSIEPGLVFYAKGWKDPDQTVIYRDVNNQIVLDENGNPRTGIKNVSSAANYLEIPVLMHYYIRTAASRYIILSAGPYAAYGVGGKRKVRGDTDRSGSEKLFYTEKTFDETGTHRFDAGATVGLGFQFNRNMSVEAETDLGIAKFNTEGRRNVTGILSFTWHFRGE